MIEKLPNVEEMRGNSVAGGRAMHYACPPEFEETWTGRYTLAQCVTNWSWSECFRTIAWFCRKIVICIYALVHFTWPKIHKHVNLITLKVYHNEDRDMT